MIALRTDRHEVTLAAHRRFVATSRPRDERCALGVALRGFTLTDRRLELANRNYQVQEPVTAPNRASSPAPAI